MVRQAQSIRLGSVKGIDSQVRQSGASSCGGYRRAKPGQPKGIAGHRVQPGRDGVSAAAEIIKADTVLIPQVADGVDLVLAEGLQHHLFLGRVLGKVKS